MLFVRLGKGLCVCPLLQCHLPNHLFPARYLRDQLTFLRFIKITILDQFNKFEYVAALATAETFEKFLCT